MDDGTKYIVTISQLAQIVKYCVQMTLHGGGDNLSHDWQPNVEEAIGLNGTRTTMLDKIPLEKYEKEEE